MPKPKHKLNKDNDLLDDVEDAIDEFVSILKRLGKKNTPIQQAHAKIKKVAEKVDDTLDDLVYQAKAAAQNVKDVAKDLIDEPTADEKALRESYHSRSAGGLPTVSSLKGCQLFNFN